jgi:hypothetical protein
VTPAGERRAAWPLVPLRRDDLLRCCEEAGLREMRDFGDYDRLPFARNSPALILLAQREQPAGR